MNVFEIAALPAQARLDRMTVMVPESGCHLYTGSWTQRGYGEISIQAVKMRAHRLSYTLANGPIPPGLMICHKCDTPQCINPEHLYAGTARDNSRDTHARKRGWQEKVTHCKSGHEYAGANLFFDKGGRKCRECSRADRRRRYWTNKTARGTA